VKLDEVLPQAFSSSGFEAGGERLGRAEPGHEQLPDCFTARRSEDRRPRLETQIERGPEKFPDAFGLTGEHDAEGRDDDVDVEALIPEGQLLGVSDPEIDLELGLGRQRLRCLDEVGAEIDGDDGGAARGDAPSRQPGARRDIEDALPGSGARRSTQCSMASATRSLILS
jgi:hypothetical protein